MQLIKFFNLSLCAIFLFSFETVAQRKNKSQKNKVSYDQSLYSSLKFREIGPFRGGRSCAVTGVDGNPNLFYFGSTGGGVWKTTDGGKTYKNISDGYFGGSIGAIAISKSDPNWCPKGARNPSKTCTARERKARCAQQAAATM